MTFPLRVSRSPRPAGPARSAVHHGERDTWWRLSSAAMLLGAALLLAAEIPARAQFGSVTRPMLGAIWFADSGQVRPLRGMPGSAVIGDAIDLGVAAGHVLPLHGTHLLVAAGDGALAVVDAGLTPPRVTALAGVRVGATRSATSARGTAAALYDPIAHRLAIVTGLPAAPSLTHTIDVSSITAPVTHLAVTDEGHLVVFATADPGGASIYVWEASVGLRFRLATTAVSAIALTAAGDAVVADPVAHDVSFLRDVARSAHYARLADASAGLSTPVGVATDGTRVHVANAGSGRVLTFDLAGRLVRTQACGCTIAGLFPVQEEVYRLTDRIDRTGYLLDARGSTVRMLFVPPARTD